MRAHRVLIPLLIIAAAAFVPVAAGAEPYPAVPPPAEVSTGTVEDGEAVTFSGTGFIVGETIEIDVEYSSNTTGLRHAGEPAGGPVVLAALTLPMEVVDTVEADSTGSFTTSVMLTQPGTAVLTATGQTSGVVVTANVTVTAESSDDDDDDSTANKGGLPTTGASRRELAIQVGAGAAAILVGIALIWLTVIRWRRRSTPTDA